MRGWGVRVMNISGMLLTFHFISLGWLFFALPDSHLALSVLLKFLGVA
jgi:D-alanyl-lipoteichoic acid acyltransferase DltB (MBOAT superfamily)